jgi:hypothetical protein
MYVEINVNKALNPMFIRINGCCMIAVFSVCPFSSLPLIELLSRPGRNQLN